MRAGDLAQVRGSGARREAAREAAAQAVEKRVDRARVGLEEKGAELVTAQATRPVVRADGSRERGGERAQEAVALLVALRVVRVLEVVEVEEDERESSAIAPGARGFFGDRRVEGLVVQEAGQRVPARALGELPGDALEEDDDRAVERRARIVLSPALEDAPERQELGEDLA